jgi:hypothetical protein
MQWLCGGHQNGLRWGLNGIDVTVFAPGPIVDFSILISAPIVSPRLAEAIEKLAPEEIERIPVRFPMGKSDLELLHILWEEDCLDRQKSEISPDGTIWRIVLQSERVRSRRIFRLAGDILIIVNGELKRIIEAGGFVGAVFAPVEIY